MFFDESEDAAEIVSNVGHVVGLCPGRDDDQWHAESILVRVVDPKLAEAMESGLGAIGLPTFGGTVWTTDAPYRETQQQLAEHAANGVLAVEMQAASLLAFSQARGMPVGVVALVTNAVDHMEKNFSKGSHDLRKRLIEAMYRGAIRYLVGRTFPVVKTGF